MTNGFIKTFLRRLRRMWGACGAHVGRMCGRALVRVVFKMVRPLDDNLNRFYNRKKRRAKEEKRRIRNYLYIRKKNGGR